MNALHKQNLQHIVGYASGFICSDRPNLTPSSAPKREVIFAWALTVVEALKELNEVRAVQVQIRGKTIWCRTDIAGNAAAIFKAVGAKIPAKVLKITTNPADTN